MVSKSTQTSSKNSLPSSFAMRLRDCACECVHIEMRMTRGFLIVLTSTWELELLNITACLKQVPVTKPKIL